MTLMYKHISQATFLVCLLAMPTSISTRWYSAKYTDKKLRSVFQNQDDGIFDPYVYLWNRVVALREWALGHELQGKCFNYVFEGYVSYDMPTLRAVQGAEVRLSGLTHQYHSCTDEDGYFSFEIPNAEVAKAIAGSVPVVHIVQDEAKNIFNEILQKVRGVLLAVAFSVGWGALLPPVRYVQFDGSRCNYAFSFMVKSRQKNIPRHNYSSDRQGVEKPILNHTSERRAVETRFSLFEGLERNQDLKQHPWIDYSKVEIGKATKSKRDVKHELEVAPGETFGVEEAIVGRVSITPRGGSMTKRPGNLLNAEGDILHTHTADLNCTMRESDLGTDDDMHLTKVKGISMQIYWENSVPFQVDGIEGSYSLEDAGTGVESKAAAAFRQCRQNRPRRYIENDWDFRPTNQDKNTELKLRHLTWFLMILTLVILFHIRRPKQPGSSNTCYEHSSHKESNSELCFGCEESPSCPGDESSVGAGTRRSRRMHFRWTFLKRSESFSVRVGHPNECEMRSRQVLLDNIVSEIKLNSDEGGIPVLIATQVVVVSASV